MPSQHAASQSRSISNFAILQRKARTWLRRPRSEKAWFLVAYPLLGLARFSLLLLPFRTIARTLGQDQKAVMFVPLATPAEMRGALAIGRAIRMAAEYTPWESKCLAQAMVAAVLLRIKGLPYGLYFGVRKDPAAANGMAAHAWVCTGPAAVTGGRSFGQFAVVGCFIYQPARRGKLT